MDISQYQAKPDKTIRQHTDDLIERAKILKEYSYVNDERIYHLLLTACEFHDYGKANPEFQKRIINHKKFNEDVEIAHNVLSLYFLNKDDFAEYEDYLIVANAVLNHHNYCDNIATVEERDNKAIIEKLLLEFKTEKVTRRTTSGICEIKEQKDAILIKGFLHKCDYSASANIPIEYKNDFLTSGLNDLMESWKCQNKNISWNSMQKYCTENTNNNIIVIAQTGMGKTEAGLLWIGDNKGYFVLPLKTAINSIYDRIKDDILNNKKIDEKLSLLHSDALTEYSKNDELNALDYHSKSKRMTLPLNISTLDQIFTFVYKYYGYELTLATLSYSKIVIDEIQMYSADLLAYLVYGIERILEVGGKVAILTATLAPFISDLLPQFEVKSFIDNSMIRHNLKVFDNQIESDIICEKYFDASLSSNKILVICNTVKKAQQIYNELRQKGVENINILHSKFTKEHRNEKEKLIKKDGETYIKSTKKINSKNCIWVCTQLVEASLDIDFDYLFTELSDINGLFQRLGRCNRKGVKPSNEPNCYVFLQINKNLLTNGNKGFIDKKIYNLSYDALKNIDGILTEQEKLDLITNTLTTDNLKGSDFYIKYNKFYNYIKTLYCEEEKIEDVTRMFRDIISYDVIPFKIYTDNITEVDENLSIIQSENENINNKIKATENILKFTVPVGHYDIYYKNYNAVKKNIDIGENKRIFVIDCNYDELGFIRLDKDAIKQIELENMYDNFL